MVAKGGGVGCDGRLLGWRGCKIDKELGNNGRIK